MDILLVWLLFLFFFFVIRSVVGPRRQRRDQASSDLSVADNLPSAEVLSEFQKRLWPVLSVTGYQVHPPGVTFEGTLRIHPREALARLRDAFVGERLTPLLEEGRQAGHVR